MSYKKIFKRETRVIAYVVIALTLIVIGTSYALFLQVNNNRNNQVVTAGSLVVEYSGGNTIQVDENSQNNCLIPQNDTSGASTGGCRFSLSITNTGTLPMQYDLLIYNNTEEAPSGAEFVDHSLIRHSLKKQYSAEETAETITSAKSLNELETNKDSKSILENSIIQVGETITFYLNVWISEEATTDSIGKYVYLKLDVVGSVSETETFANYIMNLSKSDSSIEKIEHEATEQTPALTDYRYVGKNPNNYVYFGCSDNCTEDNLYRIIGVIPTKSSEDGSYENRVKLVKASNYEGKQNIETGSKYTKSGNGYRWNTTNENKWEESSLQEVLNNEYWNSLGEYQKYISPAVWYLGAPIGDSSAQNTTTEQYYNDERSLLPGLSKGVTNYSNNIGLMYPSDYGYSLTKTYWQQPMYKNSETNKENTWLHRDSEVEWSITPEQIVIIESTGNKAVFAIGNGSAVTSSLKGNIYGIRPSFYLKDSVIFSSGSGSVDDPYQIRL